MSRREIKIIKKMISCITLLRRKQRGYRKAQIMTKAQNSIMQDFALIARRMLTHSSASKPTRGPGYCPSKNKMQAIRFGSGRPFHQAENDLCDSEARSTSPSSAIAGFGSGILKQVNTEGAEPSWSFPRRVRPVPALRLSPFPRLLRESDRE